MPLQFLICKFTNSLDMCTEVDTDLNCRSTSNGPHSGKMSQYFSKKPGQHLEMQNTHLPPSWKLTKGLMYVLQRRQRMMDCVSGITTGTSWGSAIGCTMQPMGSWYRALMPCKQDLDVKQCRI